MDIFVEPVLPLPRLLILGASPVAAALASLAPTFGFEVTVAAAPADWQRFPEGVIKLDGVAPSPDAGRGAFVVVSTQGAGDRAALKAAAACGARYAGFVGSRRKAETLKRELAAEGVDRGGARSHQGAGGARHPRHHLGGNRAVDPRRDGCCAPRAGSRRRALLLTCRSCRMTAVAVLPAPPRAALAFALALALLVLPDCCLTGRHAGVLMVAPICRALR